MSKKIILLVEDNPDNELLTTCTQKNNIIIDCIDKQEIKVGAEKSKESEIKLRKMFEINKIFATRAEFSKTLHLVFDN